MSHGYKRPKVFRTHVGCCICCVKTSTSRFTDTTRFAKDELIKCFRLSKERQGEICNACVLILKRWQKLPSGSDKHWHHIVDSRVGRRGWHLRNKGRHQIKDPAALSQTNSNGSRHQSLSDISTASADRSSASDIELEYVSKDTVNDHVFDTESTISSLSITESSNGIADTESQCGKISHSVQTELPSYTLNTKSWYRVEICCGTIFKGSSGEVLVDPKYLKPVCNVCTRHNYPQYQTISEKKNIL